MQASLNTVFGAGNTYVSGPVAGVYTVAIMQGAATLTPTGAFTGGSSPAIAAAQVTQTTGAKNLFYTQDSVLMASRALPLPPPGSGAIGTVMTDPVTGITMRLVTSWNPNYGSEQITLDLLFGIAPMRPEHLVLVQTAS